MTDSREASTSLHKEPSQLCSEWVAAHMPVEDSPFDEEVLYDLLSDAWYDGWDTCWKKLKGWRPVDAK